jgi:cell division protein FtsB
MKLLAVMDVAPALRRWAARLALALVVAIGLGYIPGEVLRRDPRTAKLQGQLDALQAEGKQLERENTALYREVEALKTDVGAIENRARADLGMVYPDEIVMRVRRGGTE